jgi:aspartate/methionine/tyrosine aminotransferase
METKESVIRLMTRLAVEHRAINLAQGFTDEAPFYDLAWGGISAIIGGTDDYLERLETLTLRQILDEGDGDVDGLLDLSIKDLLARLQNPQDRFNQYSYPFGLPELRRKIADYTQRLYQFRPDPETEITVVLGATEGVSSVLRALCEPGDGVVVFQPFHEMYPAQAAIFGLRPQYATLREDPARGTWDLDRDELEKTVDGTTRVLILNTPHNPTGKVFSRDELLFIAAFCQRHDLLLITDEIYEHIVYDGRRHYCPASFEGMRERTFVVNSISKTGNATGWRIGWVLSPAAYTTRIRSIHDTLVIQAPTPLQKGAERLLCLDHEVYREIGRNYAQKRAVLLQGLQGAGFRISPPEGSYYLFADYRQVPALQGRTPMEAALYLIKKAGVAPVPGDNFYRIGDEGEHYLRFAFCRSIESLREAGQLLAQNLT